MSQVQCVGIVIPAASLARAKSRLAHVLTPGQRRALVLDLLDRTVHAARRATGADKVVVISPDPDVLTRVEGGGVARIRQQSRGLNPAIREAQEHLAMDGATVLVVVPIDLPLIDAGELARLIGTFTEAVAERPGGVALVTDRAGTGTNMLMVAPLGLIPFAFGRGSRFRHRAAARRNGAVYMEFDSPLRFDLDEPADLAAVDYRTHQA